MITILTSYDIYSNKEKIWTTIRQVSATFFPYFRERSYYYYDQKHASIFFLIIRKFLCVR